MGVSRYIIPPLCGFARANGFSMTVCNLKGKKTFQLVDVKVEICQLLVIRYAKSNLPPRKEIVNKKEITEGITKYIKIAAQPEYPSYNHMSLLTYYSNVVTTMIN